MRKVSIELPEEELVAQQKPETVKKVKSKRKLLPLWGNVTLSPKMEKIVRVAASKEELFKAPSISVGGRVFKYDDKQLWILQPQRIESLKDNRILNGQRVARLADKANEEMGQKVYLKPIGDSYQIVRGIYEFQALEMAGIDTAPMWVRLARFFPEGHPRLAAQTEDEKEEAQEQETKRPSNAVYVAVRSPSEVKQILAAGDRAGELATELGYSGKPSMQAVALDLMGGDYIGQAVPDTILEELGRYSYLIEFDIGEQKVQTFPPEFLGEALYRGDPPRINSFAVLVLNDQERFLVGKGDKKAWRRAGVKMIRSGRIPKDLIAELKDIYQVPLSGLTLTPSRLWQADRLKTSLVVNGKQLDRMLTEISFGKQTIAKPSKVLLRIEVMPNMGKLSATRLNNLKHEVDAKLHDWTFHQVRDKGRSVVCFYSKSMRHDPEALKQVCVSVRETVASVVGKDAKISVKTGVK